VQISRLYLRNYRVYEKELDLAIPGGLVGVFGANGGGKTTLLEAILWTLWGKARTAKEDIRTAGVNGDCVTEVEFEHEGHLFLVRRSITGINSTVKAEAFADNLQVANGVRDVKQYVHSVLGMDDGAFRASVFAEQKQVAAFSNLTPTARRDLVLKLLGVTPLDVARDAARKDARAAREDVERVRSLLVDLDELRPRVDQAKAAAEVAADEAASEATAAATAAERFAAAEAAFTAIDEVRQEHDALVREGKGARAEVDRARQQLEQLTAELEALATAETKVAPLAAAAAGLADAEQKLQLVQAVARAEAALATWPAAGAEPPDPDDAAVDSVRAEAEEVAAAANAIVGERKAAAAELARARDQLEKSASLSADEDCPLCGQELGDAFDQVRSHREQEVEEASARLDELAVRERELTQQADAVHQRLKTAMAEAKKARAAREAWLDANQQRAAAERVAADARAALGRDVEPGEAEELVARVAALREAAREAARLGGLLERKPVALAARAEAENHLADAEHRRSILLDKVKSLGFVPEKLDAARAARDDAKAKAAAAQQRAEAARTVALAAAKEAEFAERRLADAEAQHAAIADRADEARHLGRLADLMNTFRTNVVASVGPRLSTQAADLFDELTDHEYDLLRVDPETYEIRIVDGGREFGIDRFSGSETDLANLALRVAISEHVRFQSGGAVGLLVLDEVFGPLDENRRERMLLALERLRSRFRQILAVTHESEIKEQFPSAIEVVKLPGRRATAHVVGA
jgi:DNA repair exonuclease SbcCD ATPase subunit